MTDRTQSETDLHTTANTIATQKKKGKKYKDQPNSVQVERAQVRSIQAMKSSEEVEDRSTQKRTSLFRKRILCMINNKEEVRWR